METVMKRVGIKQARQTLPNLITKVEAGEEIMITRQGKPVARLVPAPGPTKQLPSLDAFRHEIGRIGTRSEILLREDRNVR